MKSNYKRIGDHIREVNVRNSELQVNTLLGINIDKYYMSSVANIVGTDMTAYKIIKQGQFACNRMHVGRDYRLPVALSKSEEEFIVSPAYDVFEIIDENVLSPEYLMMWFSRKEFDRNAWFYTDADVRGGLPWNSFYDMQLPVPHIDKQKEIVKEYNTIVNRIDLNNQIIKRLEETAQAIYKQWFVDFEFPDEEGKPYKSNGGGMKFNEELQREIPKGWRYGNIGEYSKVKSGFAFKSEWWQKEGTPVIKIGSIQNNTIDILNMDCVSDDKIEIAQNYLVTKGNVVIAMTGATVGKIGIVPTIKNKILVNQRVGMFNIGDKPIEKVSFLFLSLMQEYIQNELANIGGDSAQENISNIEIEGIKLIMPKEELITNFNKICEPIIDTILNKIEENFLLDKTKNLLLSKLATIEN